MKTLSKVWAHAFISAKKPVRNPRKDNPEGSTCRYCERKPLYRVFDRNKKQWFFYCRDHKANHVFY